MVALFTLILKTTIPLERLTFKWLEVGGSEVDEFDISNNVEYTKKSEKTFKS